MSWTGAICAMRASVYRLLRPCLRYIIHSTLIIDKTLNLQAQTRRSLLGSPSDSLDFGALESRW